MKHLDGAPLPAIREEPEERAWEERIGDLLREADRGAVPGALRLVLRGGTAAKIGHGLNRPSKDIDGDMTGPGDVWALLCEAAQSAGLTALAKPERRRAQKGRLVLSEPLIGAVSVEVDVRTIRDPEMRHTVENGAIAHRRHGVLMYTAQELARQKIEMATEPGRRRRAKDRYDITWWLRNRPECIAPQHRVALDRALRDGTLAQQWDLNHRKDPIMRRIESTIVQDALMRTLDCDPAVLQDRMPDGILQVQVRMTGGAELAWQTRRGTKEKRTIATFDTDRELESFMVRMGLWSRDSVTEMLKELTRERERAKERTR